MFLFSFSNVCMFPVHSDVCTCYSVHRGSDCSREFQSSPSTWSETGSLAHRYIHERFSCLPPICCKSSAEINVHYHTWLCVGSENSNSGCHTFMASTLAPEPPPSPAPQLQYFSLELYLDYRRATDWYTEHQPAPCCTAQ